MTATWRPHSPRTRGGAGAGGPFSCRIATHTHGPPSPAACLLHAACCLLACLLQAASCRDPALSCQKLASNKPFALRGQLAQDTNVLGQRSAVHAAPVPGSGPAPSGLRGHRGHPQAGRRCGRFGRFGPLGGDLCQLRPWTMDHGTTGQWPMGQWVRSQALPGIVVHGLSLCTG